MKSSKQNKQAKFLKNIIKKKTQQVFFAKIFFPPCLLLHLSLSYTHGSQIVLLCGRRDVRQR